MSTVNSSAEVCGCWSAVCRTDWPTGGGDDVCGGRIRSFFDSLVHQWLTFHLCLFLLCSPPPPPPPLLPHTRPISHSALCKTSALKASNAASSRAPNPPPWLCRHLSSSRCWTRWTGKELRRRCRRWWWRGRMRAHVRGATSAPRRERRGNLTVVCAWLPWRCVMCRISFSVHYIRPLSSAAQSALSTLWQSAGECHAFVFDNGCCLFYLSQQLSNSELSPFSPGV